MSTLTSPTVQNAGNEGREFQLFAQELEVGHIERAIFEHLKITTLRTPEAERRIRPGSFVFLPNVLVDSGILARCHSVQPSLLFGRSVAQMLGNAEYFSIAARE